MATLSSLIELSNRHEARSVKWKKNGIFYSCTFDGVLLEINMAVPSCRINKGEWHKLWSGTRASIKAQAIRLTMPNNLIHCPNPLCNDEGWYAEGSHEEGWEQVQCEFCYTNPNSYFNALQQSGQPTLESGRDLPAESNNSEGSAP